MNKSEHESAAEGSALAQYHLGLACFRGDGVPQDHAQAVIWYLKAAERGLAEAQNSLGFMLSIGMGVHQDHVQAAMWYHRAADQGLAEAQHNLGCALEEGNGVRQDHRLAAFWFRKADRDAEAQHNLGCALMNGISVRQDHVQAAICFRKAADQGNAKSQYNLGCALMNGLGVTQDHAQAAIWYRKASDQGHAAAQYNFSKCYYYGLGVPKDAVQCASWLKKAADQGHADAEYGLGFAYMNGLGITRDHAQAAIWYRKAANQGHAAAQYNLSKCYYDGLGVSKDAILFASWLKKAADQGHADAEYGLGFAYLNGLGITQDHNRGYELVLASGKRGFVHAQYLLGGFAEVGRFSPKDRAVAIRWYVLAAKQKHDESIKALHRLGVLTGLPEQTSLGFGSNDAGQVPGATVKEPIRPLVDVNAVKKIMSITNQGLRKRIDRDSLLDALMSRVMGQRPALEQVADAVANGLAKIKRTRPVACMLFVGPPGVGKTETAKALAQAVFGDKDSLVVLNGGEYQNHEDGVGKLIGFGPSYANSEMGGTLTRPMFLRPERVVLFDEIEKMHPTCYNTLLSLLNDGEVIEGGSKKAASFREAVVLMTANLDHEACAVIAAAHNDLDARTQAFKDHFNARGFARPEILDRIPDILYFRPLAMDDMIGVVSQKIAEVACEYGVTITAIAPEAVALVLRHVGKGGVRAVVQVIERRLGRQLGNLSSAGHLNVSVSVKDGALLAIAASS